MLHRRPHGTTTECAGGVRYTRGSPMNDRKKRGRPPGGDNPGERVVDYPQLSVRVPRATLRKLRAAATVQRLSHAKVLADAMDRYLDALQPDQRTLVEGLLRRATDVFEQPSKRPNTDRASRPITVLNVDDHEAALFARSSILRKEGWNVVEAQTGRGALEAVRRHQPGCGAARRAPARHQRPGSVPPDQGGRRDTRTSRWCRSRLLFAPRSISSTASRKAAPTCT